MIDNTKRLNFLRKEFNVIDFTDKEAIKDLFSEYNKKKFEPTIVASARATSSELDQALCLVFIKEIIEYDISGNIIRKVDDSGNVVAKQHTDIYINETVFSAIIDADPTKNKVCSQWMINLFTNYLKDNDIEHARRYYDEDLGLANENLKIFEANKRKKAFKIHCVGNPILKGVEDYMNINQYKSLGQLYDAIDPFFERDTGVVERKLLEFVEKGEAVIPVRDRKFTVYVPKTIEASTVFSEFASWCTAKKENSNFNSYRNNLQPNGEKSDLFIIIDNKFFTGTLKSNTLHQIHFESNQVRNRIQAGDTDFYSNVLRESEGVSNFFYDTLIKMAGDKGDVNNNQYLTYLIKFGWTEALFDLIEKHTPMIKIMDNDVPRIPNLSKFTEVQTCLISDSKVVDIDPSIGQLKTLEMLSLPNNKISALPKEIGNLKNLTFLNIKGNKGIRIPEEIKYLDKSNGGSLYKLAVRESDIGEKEYARLKELLPETEIKGRT